MEAEHIEADDDLAARPSRRLEIVAAAVCVVVMGLVVIGAGGIEVRTETDSVGPRSWPTMLGWVGLGLASVLLVTSALRRAPARGDLDAINRPGVIRCAAAVALAAIYVGVWNELDFRVTTPLFLAAIVAVFGGRTWQSLLLYPVVTTGGIYVLFHTVLQVPL